jgi:hypothetical protein
MYVLRFRLLNAPNSFCAAPLPLSEPCVPASGRNEWVFLNLESQSAIESGFGVQMGLEDAAELKSLSDGRIWERCGRFTLDNWGMVRPGFSLSPHQLFLSSLLPPPELES